MWLFNGDGGTKIKHRKAKQFTDMTEGELLDLINMPEPGGSYAWAVRAAQKEYNSRIPYEVIEECECGCAIQK